MGKRYSFYYYRGFMVNILEKLEEKFKFDRPGERPLADKLSGIYTFAFDSMRFSMAVSAQSRQPVSLAG